MNKSDPRENKNQRIIDALEKMKEGDIVTPTNFFRSIGIAPSTGCSYFDLFDSLNEINFETSRNSEGVIKGIIKLGDKESSSKNIMKELNQIKKEIKELKDAKD